MGRGGVRSRGRKLERRFADGVIFSVLVGFVLLGYLMYRFDADGILATAIRFSAIGAPLGLFVGFWKLSGLEREALTENLDQYLENLRDSFDESVRDFDVTGMPPSFEKYRRQVAHLSRYDPRHPAAAALTRRIGDAESSLAHPSVLRRI